MRWLPFALLAIVAIVCQTTIVPRLMTIHSIWPEWVVVLAVHYALWGPWPEAAIAAWILGLTVDLQSVAPDPIGLHAFSYGLAAWAVIRIRSVLFRDHPVTHALVTFAFTLGVHAMAGFYYWWKLSGTLDTEGLWRPALLFAGYTAVWAPCLHWLLLKLQRWTGLGPSRRRLTYRPESPA